MFKISLTIVVTLMFAGSLSAFSSPPITIDGSFRDWDPVLTDTNNTLSDPYRHAGDGDEATISKDTEDIRLIAATWDANYFNFYVQTSQGNLQTQSTSKVIFLVYIDANHDFKMGGAGTTDRVVSYSFDNQGFQEAAIYDYNPVNPGGDEMLVPGDGSSMPGSLVLINPTPSSMEGAVSASGVEYEARISWNDLGTGGQIAPVLKFSSSKNGSIISDNTELLDLLIPKTSVTPDNNSATGAGVVIQYQHTVTNESTGNDILNISASSTQGFTASFERWDGVAWVAMLDADSNGTPDAGPMGPEDSFVLRVSLTIPPGISAETTDITTVFATSSVDSNVQSQAKDKTAIGDITLRPDQFKVSEAGATVRYLHKLANHTSSSLTLELSTVSTPAWPVSTYADGNCDGVEDGPPIAFIEVNAGLEVCLVLAVTIPGGITKSTSHTATLTASNTAPALSASTTDTTTVDDRVVVDPGIATAITVAGAALYYDHTIINNQPIPDSFDLAATPSLVGWTAEVFAEDGFTRISSVGPIEAFGGKERIRVKVTPPATAVEQDVNDTSVTITPASGSDGDSAADTTLIRRVATYTNSDFTLPEVQFGSCSLIYMKGSNLTDNDYRIRWFDPSSVVPKRTVTDVAPDINNQVTDSYQLLPADSQGTWTVEVDTKKGSNYGDPVYTTYFDVSTTGNVDSLATNQPDYLPDGNTITVTSNLTNAALTSIQNSVARYVIYRDADNSNTPTNGEVFLQSDGQTGIFDGTAFSHTSVIPAILSMATHQDQFSIPNANFGSGNTGTWKVYMEWRSSCDSAITGSPVPNVTFTVVASCPATATVGPVTVQKSGSQYLVTWTAVSDPCFSNYVLLGSDNPNPASWDPSMVLASTSDTFYQGDLTGSYYQVLVQSIDGSYGPR